MQHQCYGSGTPNWFELAIVRWFELAIVVRWFELAIVVRWFELAIVRWFELAFVQNNNATACCSITIF